MAFGTSLVLPAPAGRAGAKTVIASAAVPWYILPMMDPKIREYLSKNGAKGGKAGKGSELRRKLNKAAVEARWAKVRAARAKEAAQVKTEAK